MGVGSATGALPVEFQYFRATSQEGEVKLEWATATESGNKGFEIQHSTDARNWQTLDFEEGFGNSATEQLYAWWHDTPQLGANYYRLKQIDYDGAFDFSDVVAVRISSVKPLEVYPNPVQETLFIVVPETSIDQSVTVDCYDMVKLPCLASAMGKHIHHSFHRCLSVFT
ncbi:MAG: hypothetical protein R2795_24760 [Saprospiraceae bacterium]